MTAAEARNLTLKNTKKPPQVEKLLEKVFVLIETAAKKGENNLEFYDKSIVKDENTIVLVKFITNLGYKVDRNALGLSIYW